MDFIVELAQPTAEFLANLGVERAERFVQEEDLGFDSQGARQGDTLTLTTGELRGITSGPAAPTAPASAGPQRVADFAFVRASGARPNPEAKGDILEHVQVAEQRVVLEGKPGLAVAGAEVGHVLAVEEHLGRAGLGEIEAGDDTEEGGLARSRRAEERDQFTRLNFETDAGRGR
jgi:hypothetical protein